jgi:AhpD family alkylhydroperoxidase
MEAQAETRSEFAFALEAFPAALKACSDISRALHGGELTPRNRAQISVLVAQRSACSYCQWVHQRRAIAGGLSAEDILLATVASAIDAREKAVLALAHMIADSKTVITRRDLEPLKAALIDDSDVLEVGANVAANILMNFAIHAVAPKTGAAIAKTGR